MEYFLKGWIVGFVIASPIGPVGVLCIRRTLTDGRLVGLLTVLGTATADAVYGLIAGVGLTAVSRVLTAHRTPFRILSGLFLFYLGGTMLRARPIVAKRTRAVGGLVRAYFSAMLLMLANPFIIVSFLAVFAAVGFETGRIGDLPAASLFAGVFLGSAAWWIIFSLAAGWLRPRLQNGGLRAINVGAGSLMWIFGLWQFAQLWVKLRP
jgi:threonine/homoserine/homoserine lactone efflux protein